MAKKLDHFNRAWPVVLFCVALIASNGCESRRVLIHVERFVDRMPISGVKVRQSRVHFGLWQDEFVAHGVTNAAGEIELPSVCKDDVIFVDGSGRVLTDLWPDEELFRPLEGDLSARSKVYFQIMRERTLETRAALARDVSPHLIVVPVLADKIGIYNDDMMTKLDPGVPVEHVQIMGMENTDRMVSLLKMRRNVTFVQMSLTSITDDGLVDLASISSVKAIDMTANKLITDRGVERALALRPDIVIRRP